MSEARLRSKSIELGGGLTEPGYEYVLLEDVFEEVRDLADRIERLPLYDEQATTMADAAESMRTRAAQLVRGLDGGR